jgi:ABC-type transport system involved in multi-copper enzyme maturation permease subunit
MKLKRSYMLCISLLIATLIPILNAIFNWQKSSIDFLMMSVNSLCIGMFLVYPCLYGIIITYLFNREYTSDMMKTLLTIPISKNNLIFSKIIVLFLWSILLCVWDAVVTIIGAIVIGTPNINISSILYVFSINLKTAPLYILCILPIVAIVVASKKSYTLSLGVSIIITAGTLIIQGTGSTKFACIYPWLVVCRFNGIQEAKAIIPFAYPAWVSLIAIISYAGISLLIIFRSFRKQDN